MYPDPSAATLVSDNEMCATTSDDDIVSKRSARSRYLISTISCLFPDRSYANQVLTNRPAKAEGRFIRVQMEHKAVYPD